MAPQPLTSEVYSPMPHHCSIPECVSVSAKRGWCWVHYGRWRRHGTPLYARPDAPARFWSKVEFTDTCWLWTGAAMHSSSHPYGQIRIGGRKGSAVLAHRWAYEFCVGAIPECLELDHLCRTPLCVNPNHLEPVTHQENIRRSVAATKTRCLRGHAFTDENTHYNARGHRFCRTCQRRYHRLRRARLKEDTLAPRKTGGS